MVKRSEFIGAAAALGTLAGTGAPALAAAPDAHADIPAFQALIAKPYRHKQIVAAVRLNNASFLHYMKNTLNAYEFSWKEGPGTTHVAAVLYGNAIAAVLDDAAWREHHLADLLQSMQDTFNAGHKDVTSNPYAGDRTKLAATGNPKDALYLSDTVAALQMRGASFFVCNNALAGICQQILGSTATPDRTEALRRDLVAHFIGGAMLVPAGVAAINAAQEQRYTYLNGNAL